MVVEVDLLCSNLHNQAMELYILFHLSQVQPHSCKIHLQLESKALYLLSLEIVVLELVEEHSVMEMDSPVIFKDLFLTLTIKVEQEVQILNKKFQDH